MTSSVSIIIVNYNYAEFLAEAIESALAQDYQATEVVLIDDGSTDNSLEVAARYPITIMTKPNGGLCKARNSAVLNVETDYVLFLDADDRLTPNAVSLLMSALSSAGAETAYAYGQMRYFGLRDDLFASHEFEPQRLAKSNYICATTLIRRQSLLQIGAYDNCFRSLREDWELYIRFWHHGYRGAFVPAIILECRKHKPHLRRALSVKALSMAKLIWLYPGIFWQQWLKHPLRYSYHMLAGRVWANVGQYADRAHDPVTVIQLSKPSNDVSADASK